MGAGWAVCKPQLNPFGIVDKLICVPDASAPVTPITSDSKTFASSTTWVFPGSEHGLGTCDLVHSEYDGSNLAFQPNTFTCNPANYDVTVTLLVAGAGKIVLAKASASPFVASFTSQTTVTMAHNYGTSDVVFACFNGSGAFTEANTVTTNTNSLVITFLVAQTGRCVVIK